VAAYKKFKKFSSTALAFNAQKTESFDPYSQ
jgi:hypothetical protein